MLVGLTADPRVTINVISVKLEPEFEFVWKELGASQNRALASAFQISNSWQIRDSPRF